jgi:hypothetical protein
MQPLWHDQHSAQWHDITQYNSMLNMQHHHLKKKLMANAQTNKLMNG